MPRRSHLIVFTSCILIVYLCLTYFYSSDSKTIILANQNLQLQKEQKIRESTVQATFNISNFKHEETNSTLNENNSLVVFPEYKSKNVTFIRIMQKRAWNQWLQSTNYTAVGDFYNHCGDDKILIGKFVMVPNSNGRRGVKFRSYLNVTWGETINSGLVFNEIWYSGIKILKFHASLCAKRKSFKCPFQRGVKYNYANDFMNIPFFMPSGNYRMKVYGEDDKKRVIICFFAEAII